MNLDELIEKLDDTNIKNAITEICKRDFLSYLLVVFFLINGSKFLLKDFHRLIIKKLQSIVECKNTKRNLALCLPVGSGKSLIIEYFITWCFARTIDCTFCYTSNSDRLINKLSKECKDIIENQHWQMLFNHPLKKDDRQRVNFSFEGAKNRTGLTAGTTGGAITGLDAGNPNIDGFSGALIIDDPLDAGNARYEKAREEVVTFYDEKLATRRRTPQTPTILIMQRLHLDDLVGWIEKNEPELWDVCKVPALNENGESFWEERYPKEELKHIQLINAFKFQAQYQQEPIALGGSVIKGEWFGYYSVNVKYDYKKIVIAADTAIQAKEHSDYSCFLVGGITQNNHLHILQMAHGKWEYPELKQNASKIYNQWQFDKRTTSASALYIEDKASGQQLIQDFKKLGLPVRPIEVTKDKLTRVEEVLDYIAAGLVELPESRSYGNNNVLISECEAFSRDMSHAHDDCCFVAGTQIATTKGKKNIEDIQIGDELITPLGKTKVLAKSQRYATVIKNIGLEGTPDHKIYSIHDDIFDKLENAKYNNCSKLDIRGLLHWEKMKLLCSMEENITLMEKKDIILHAMTTSIKKRGQGCIETFGSFIQDKKYQKAIKFITLISTRLIMILVILNVYRFKNTIKGIKNAIGKFGNDPKCKKQVQKVEKNAKNGTRASKGKNGIANIKRKPYQKMLSEKYVPIAGQNLELGTTKENRPCAENAEINISKENYEEKQKKLVYNIQTDKGIYYANNILVSNCDALVHLINNTIAKREVSILEVL